MNNKQKLELTWIGKGKDPKLEPRILIEDPEKSYGDPKSENMLIHGDNLLALKALEQDFAGKIKCIYIDPPYNTGSAFSKFEYEDNLEHSIWLSLIKPRLELLKRLLHPTEGSLWISIDDDESHYLKVLCDEVFGRNNFVANVIWEKKYTISNDAKWFSDNHDHVLVYASNKDAWRPYKLPRTEEMDKAYKNPDNHPKGVWKATPIHAKSGSDKGKEFVYTFKNGISWRPPKGTFPRFSEETLRKLDENNELWFGKDGKSTPAKKTFLIDLNQAGTPARTIWGFKEVGHNHEAKEEVKLVDANEVFTTPKPERFIKRILELATKENDWALDSFLGSGTTAAVAHKMGRKYIGIELGNHAVTHCLPRLKKVVDGTDGLELSKTLNWKGGGGFKFYNLAPSLLKKDALGNWVFDKSYNATMLSAAVCKHEGFRFKPDEMCYWKQGQSTKTDYIFVTTNFLTLEQLDRIHDEMKPQESLLICAKSFASECLNKYPTITVKKIPQAILGKCEFGAENYDLNIIQNTEEEAEIQEETI